MDEFFLYYIVCKVIIYFLYINFIIFMIYFLENKMMICLLFYYGFFNWELCYSCLDDYKLFCNINKNVLFVIKLYKFWYFVFDLMIW